MGRKRLSETTEKWDADSAARYMHEQFIARAKDVSSGLENSAVSAIRDVGIYLPHLVLRTVFQRTCFPLERSMILFGPTGSNKSALLYYFYDLFRRNNGKYLHLEVEDKDTPILRLSLLDYDQDAGWVTRCESMNHFMSNVKGSYEWFKSVCNNTKAPGKRVPFVIGIDSLVAKMTDEAAAVMDKNDGVPGRRFADEARALSDWFKLVPGYLQGWPFALIAVNHDKPKAGPRMGTMIHSTPGGSAPNYYATYKVLVEKVKQLKQLASGIEGNRIRLTMEKCSLAAGKRSIEVDLVWWMEEGLTRTGKKVITQRTSWDWDKATTEMLFMIVANKDKEGARAKVISELVGIQRAGGGRYYSNTMGIPSSESVPPAVFGRMLEARRDILDELEPRLGIHNSYRFIPGEDFSEQLDSAASLVDDYIPIASMSSRAISEIPNIDSEEEPEEVTSEQEE